MAFTQQTLTNNMKAMQHSNDTFYKIFGGGIGTLYSLLDVKNTWVMGEAWKITEALICGAAGALGAFLIKRYFIDKIWKKTKP